MEYVCGVLLRRPRMIVVDTSACVNSRWHQVAAYSLVDTRAPMACGIRAVFGDILGSNDAQHP